MYRSTTINASQPTSRGESTLPSIPQPQLPHLDGNSQLLDGQNVQQLEFQHQQIIKLYSQLKTQYQQLQEQSSNLRIQSQQYQQIVDQYMLLNQEQFSLLSEKDKEIERLKLKLKEMQEQLVKLQAQSNHQLEQLPAIEAPFVSTGVVLAKIYKSRKSILHGKSLREIHQMILAHHGPICDRTIAGFSYDLLRHFLKNIIYRGERLNTGTFKKVTIESAHSHWGTLYDLKYTSDIQYFDLINQANSPRLLENFYKLSLADIHLKLINHQVKNAIDASAILFGGRKYFLTVQKYFKKINYEKNSLTIQQLTSMSIEDAHKYWGANYYLKQDDSSVKRSAVNYFGALNNTETPSLSVSSERTITPFSSSFAAIPSFSPRLFSRETNNASPQKSLEIKEGKELAFMSLVEPIISPFLSTVNSPERINLGDDSPARKRYKGS